jgi:hypothetical protein
VNKRSLEAGRLCKITPGRAEATHRLAVVTESGTSR